MSLIPVIRRTPGLRSVQILGLACVTVLLTSIVLKIGMEVRHNQQRSRFVINMVKEQMASINRVPSSGEMLRVTHAWPDQFTALQSWLVLNLLRSRDPVRAAEELNSLSRDHVISPALQLSLDRWRTVLQRWSRVRAFVSSSPLSAEQLLDEGRRANHEAAGFTRIGRGFDATPLYLWSGSALLEFIERDPSHPNVPEALYLLGETHLRLKSAFPGSVRSDRILNLCAELYPESIWSLRARALWQDEEANRIQHRQLAPAATALRSFQTRSPRPVASTSGAFGGFSGFRGKASLGANP